MGCLILKDTSLSKCEVQGCKLVHSFLENFWLRFFYYKLAEAEFTDINSSLVYLHQSMVDIVQPGFYNATLLQISR